MRLQKRPISVTKETYSCYKRDKVTLIEELVHLHSREFSSAKGLYKNRALCKRALQEQGSFRTRIGFFYKRALPIQGSFAGKSYQFRKHTKFSCSSAVVCCGVLQCVVVCRSVLQCVAVRYCVLLCVAVCCSVFLLCCSVLLGSFAEETQRFRKPTTRSCVLRVAVCCRVLQCVAGLFCGRDLAIQKAYDSQLCSRHTYLYV